jgi:hypothetical protein
VCLRRWAEQGLVYTAGERARIYFNQLKSREVDGSLRVADLLFEYPGAILSGESVWHSNSRATLGRRDLASEPRFTACM